eukprot:1598878-Rhodomonas_salina.1
MMCKTEPAHGTEMRPVNAEPTKHDIATGVRPRAQTPVPEASLRAERWRSAKLFLGVLSRDGVLRTVRYGAS